MGRTSDSFRYDSHCVTVVEISHGGPPSEPSKAVPLGRGGAAK